MEEVRSGIPGPCHWSWGWKKWAKAPACFFGGGLVTKPRSSGSQVGPTLDLRRSHGGPAPIFPCRASLWCRDWRAKPEGSPCLALSSAIGPVAIPWFAFPRRVVVASKSCARRLELLGQGMRSEMQCKVLPPPHNPERPPPAYGSGPIQDFLPYSLLNPTRTSSQNPGTVPAGLACPRQTPSPASLMWPGSLERSPPPSLPPPLPRSPSSAPHQSLSLCSQGPESPPGMFREGATGLPASCAAPSLPWVTPAVALVPLWRQIYFLK